uniref:GTP-binding protein RAD-like n=1 Tax=Cyprinus carpio TaxID=7962 RepID=A0A8C1XKE5_CYPCA
MFGVMTLNKGDKLRNMDKRRGSMPFPLHLQTLHRRSMPVDDRELRSMPEAQPTELSSLMRFSPEEEHGNSCVSDSSDSVISSGSDSDGQVYKVVLLGEHGVGKSSLARIFGGVEDSNDCEETGNTYDRSLVVDDEETSILLYDIWEQDNSQWLKDQCMRMGDAYIIVYSVTDKSSFEKASELRIQLRRARQSENIPIILVGNKSDLVRSREVSVDGKISATFFSVLNMAGRNRLCSQVVDVLDKALACLLSFEEQSEGIVMMTRSLHPSGNEVHAHLHMCLFPPSL